MHLNSFNRALKEPTIKVLALLVCAFCTIFFLAAFITDRSEGEGISKRVNIAVRAIGHDLLLRAGDSTSLIPPVVEKSEGVFVLEFENEFVFQPDTLVTIAQRNLDKTGLTRYTVTVHECHKTDIVYGFEINPPENSIMACKGRVQPKACYKIEIAFADFPTPTPSYVPIGIMLGGVSLLLAFVLLRRNFGAAKMEPATQHNPAVVAEPDSKSFITIGKFLFDTTNQHLKIGDEIIVLTDKECKILMLLNRNIGQLTLREDLIQEVWTDEGVITGRSLDMFISRLRKKLSADADLRITNVHGKGYRLEGSGG